MFRGPRSFLRRHTPPTHSVTSRRMKRILLVAIVVLAIVALIAITVRIQPAGSARIVRDGDALQVKSNRIGFVPLGGTPCIAPFANGLGRFDRVMEIEDGGGETIAVAIRFDYAVPDRVPASWPAGDWCASLAARVEQIAKTWIVRADVDALRRDP